MSERVAKTNIEQTVRSLPQGGRMTVRIHCLRAVVAGAIRCPTVHTPLTRPRGLITHGVGIRYVVLSWSEFSRTLFQKPQ